MIQDGHKGAVLQRDKQTYAIAPHFPCGLVTPQILRKIADVAEKFHTQAVKCTSAERIAIIGLREEDLDAVWTEFAAIGLTNPGHMTGSRVRSVKACPGTQFCKRGRQDSLALGLELDQLYHGKPLPGKLKIGVSGCPNQCAETCIKDIGLVGGLRGWTIYVGGMGGSYPRLAEPLHFEEITTDTALKLVDQILFYFQKNARDGERLGDILDRLGLAALQKFLGLAAT